MFRLTESARLLIVGQAPGTKVHATGIPWNDPSGDRLRSWLALDRDAFYGERHRDPADGLLLSRRRLPRGGDRPPTPGMRAALASAASARMLPTCALTLLVGAYAQAYYLGGIARRVR